MPIYPIVNSEGFASNLKAINDTQYACLGLTKREYFAAMFMQPMIAGEGAKMIANRDERYNETNWKEVVTLNAIEFADELIKHLNP